ncbi:termination of G-protein coupled receptor signaling pathway, partial [Blomia tropicalis]
MSNHLKSINNNNATTMSTTKVVEIVRSKYGYGFTLSGEMPCHLTEVKGHANVAGLNSGDRLNTVNGECVDRLTHAQVVSLITKVADGRLSLGITPFDIMDECSLPSTDDDDDDEDEEEGVPGARSISSCSMMTTTSTSSSTSSICDVTTAASTTTTSKKAVGDVSRLIPIRSDLANLTSNNGRDKSPSSLPLPMQSHHSRTKRSTERTNVNHKVRNILRPSQTYETNFNNCNNNINKLSRIRRHRSNIGLLHLSDSDLPNGEQESTQTQQQYAPPPPPPPLKPPPPSLPPSSSASLNTSTSTNNTVNTNRVKCKNGKIPKNSRKTNSTTSGISSTSPSSLSSSESSPSSTSERDPNRTIIPSSSLSSLEPNQVPIPTPAKRFSRLK